MGLLDFISPPDEAARQRNIAFFQQLAQAGAPSATPNSWALGLANGFGEGNKAQIAYQRFDEQQKQLQAQNELQKLHADSLKRDQQMEDELSTAFQPKPLLNMSAIGQPGSSMFDMVSHQQPAMDIKSIAETTLPIYAKYGKTKDALNMSKIATYGDPDQTEYGLVPQKGINPASGKQEMFIQDKLGRTKWLGIEPTPDMQFVAPTDYRAGFMVDKRNPTAPAINIGGTPNGPIGYSQNSPVNAQPAAATDPNAPWKRIVSPAEQDKMKDRIYQSARKQLDESGSWISGERDKLALMGRFGQLNEKQATGGIQSADWLPNMVAPNDVVEMRSLTAKLTPNERPAGSGATSDFEQKMYRQAVPSPDKPGPVNGNIMAFRRAMVDDAQQQQSFLESYLSQYGHLNGADKIWQQYKKENPILAPKASDKDFAINPNRTSFDQWLQSRDNSKPAQKSFEPPANAADYLRRNYKLDRSLISAFDAKYGPGSAAAILKGN